MRFLIPFSLALAITGPAAAQVIPSTGLGTGGFVQVGAPMTATRPGERLWVITGDKTDPVAFFSATIPMAAIEGPNTTGHRRANCTVQPMQTEAIYAWGMPTPRWPSVDFQWSERTTADLAAGTETLLAFVHAPGLDEYSNYSLDLVCVAR